MLGNDINFDIVDNYSGYGIDIIDEFIGLLFFENGQYIQIKAEDLFAQIIHSFVNLTKLSKMDNLK